MPEEPTPAVNDPAPSPSLTPLTDKMRAQYDYWDNYIDDIKEQGYEYAKEKLKRLAQDIREWALGKEDELNKQNEEKSPVVQAIEDFLDAIENVGSDIAKLIKALKDFVTSIANWIAGAVLDIAGALAVVTTRTPVTLAKCVILPVPGV